MGSTEAERTPLADSEEASFNPPPKYDAEAQNSSELEKFVEEKAAPVDKKNLVFLIILLHGIGTLMPWNMFINIAPAYYKDYKMMDRNETGHLVKTSLSENFPLYLSLCSQLPNLLLNFINIFITVKGDLTKRISMSLSVVALTVIATMCFIYVDTWTWRIGFCVLTLATIVVLNSANGIYQNSIYGLAADFPFKYTNAVIIGNNACGTFVAVVNIVAFMLIDDVRGSAFLYFSIALLTLVVCFSSLFTLKKNPFYVFYRENSAAAAASADTKDEEPKLTKQDYIDTFKQGWPMFLNVFLVFFVTLTCFPGLMMFVTPNGVGEKYDFPLLAEKDFTSFNCFLLFNLFAFIGSLLAGRFQYPGAKKLWIPVYLRVLFIPFFFFCNLRVENRMWPVYISSPWAYIFGAILMSISSGYLSGLAMQFAPSVVEPSKQRIAGMMAGFFLIFGIVSGLTFTIVIMSLLTNFGPLAPAVVAL